MQILIAWQAANLSPEDAERRWQATLGAWQARYQDFLTGRRLHVHSTSAGLLFCGLLAQPANKTTPRQAAPSGAIVLKCMSETFAKRHPNGTGSYCNQNQKA